jgi:hypothetical protein
MRDEDIKRPAAVSRKDLYRRVWETPITRLAAEYGISANALAKICDQLKIPYPPRGHWAKKAAGKKVVEYRLPEPDSNTPLEVMITPTPAPTPAPALPPELEATIDAVREKVAKISVSSRLVRPHPIIAAWLADHERKKREAKQERDPFHRQIMQPAKLTDLDRRKLRIQDALFKALELHGFIIKSEQYRGVYFEIENERIDYVLREKQKQVRRPLTDDEKRWGFDHNKPWRQELKPTGILVFAIKTYLGNGLQDEWIETADKPIEAQVPDIVAALLLAGQVLAARRRKHIKDEKRHHEEQRRRHIEKRRQQQDVDRWQRFVTLAQQWKSAEAVRQFLAALENTPQFEGITYGDRSPVEWQNWAQSWLEKFDSLIGGPEKIYSDLAEEHPPNSGSRHFVGLKIYFDGRHPAA